MLSFCCNKKENISARFLLSFQIFIILANFNEELNYKIYNQIRNKVYIAFNEVRDEFSKEKFGKSAEELISSKNEVDYAKWNELKQIFPIRYTETIAQ